MSFVVKMQQCNSAGNMLSNNNSQKSPKPVSKDNWLYRLGKRAATSSRTFIAMSSFLGLLILLSWHFSKEKFHIAFVSFFKHLHRMGPSNLWPSLIVNFLFALALASIAGVQLRNYNAEIYIANIIVFGMTREITPLIVAAVLLIRSGPTLAIDMAILRKRGQATLAQHSILQDLDVFVLPRIFAMLFVAPILYIWANFVAICAGFLIATWQFEMNSYAYMEQMISAFSISDLIIGMVKTTLFGFLIAFSACYYGFKQGRQARLIGRAVTTGINVGVAFIIVSDTLLEIVLTNIR